MKRLVVCCDGTWNTPEQEENNIPAPTNVVRLYNALADRDKDDNEQLKYYHPGVGTDGNFFARTAGGMFGAGIDKNIMSAYAWIARHYRAGDAICLFGFSRGAYTVRSLAGLICKLGLPVLGTLANATFWSRVETAYQQGYRDGKSPATWRPTTWRWVKPGARLKITFIGVWDTVGALGVPDDLGVLNIFDEPDRWRFHDTRLSPKVLRARHAVAIDEKRANFAPTLWSDENGAPIYDSKRVKQRWFAGVHSDVGGGYAVHGLSDITLKWMIDEADAVDIGFEPSMIGPGQIDPDPQAPLHDSRKGMFANLPTQPRSIPRFSANAPELHESAVARFTTPPISQAPYHKTTTLTHKGVSKTVEVYAREEWNETQIFLEEGHTYDFEATGEWLDKKIPCGPGGTRDGRFHAGELAHMMGSLIGKLEKAFQKYTDNKKADFKFTRRVEDAPWFSLIGVIADGGNPKQDGTLDEHSRILIGGGLTGFVPKKSGYLYAFANDAWHFYDNNRGSVTLTVTRKT